jgi:hypothetical protein
MPLHVVYIRFGMIKLIIGEGNGKTGFYFLRFHGCRLYVILFNSYAVIIYDFTKKAKQLSIPMPAYGHLCSGLEQIN